jgi:A/G-specific adenine glycosylase
MNFSNILIRWYLQNKRAMPWRITRNPYYIWLSEIILQQTRVAQGTSYYLKFIAVFPKVEDLANATEEEVLKLWQGLGYYSRARNLHFSAKYIMNDLKGEFPESYNELLKLKGVGDYTASAVASICYNEPTAVVDGNVYRVLSRYFGVTTPINSSKGIKEFKKLAQELIDHSKPGEHNQAIMEFGAVLCKPQNPDCPICALNTSCAALQQKKVKELPVKENKIKIKHRYFNYLATISPDANTILMKRTGKGIWQNLYEFPLIETEMKIEELELLDHNDFQNLFGERSLTLKRFNPIEKIHKLSHQHLHSTFWIVKYEGNLSKEIPWNEVDNFPVPILIHNFVEELKQTELFSIFE